MTPRTQPDEGLNLPPILSPFVLGGDNTILPPIEPNISRPPSASSQSSSHYVHPRPSPRLALQLPGLSQLAAMTSSPASRRGSLDSVDTQRASQIQFRPAVSAQSMTPTTVATVGLGGQLPVCQNCATSTTPMWRRDENGTVLCNACGLFLKLHGRPRPISLKTDTIKSRNRVRLPGEAAEARRKSAKPQAAGESSESGSKSAKRARIWQQTAVVALQRSQSPLSRASASGNIAPQSIFDSIASDHQTTPGSSSALHVESTNRSESPSRLEDGANPAPSGRRSSYDLLLKEATSMQTRINELDVINVLIKGRVEELETLQQQARSNESAAREAERNAQTALDDAKRQLTSLRQRVQQLESQLAATKT